MRSKAILLLAIVLLASCGSFVAMPSIKGEQLEEFLVGSWGAGKCGEHNCLGWDLYPDGRLQYAQQAGSCVEADVGKWSVSDNYLSSYMGKMEIIEVGISKDKSKKYFKLRSQNGETMKFYQQTKKSNQYGQTDAAKSAARLP